MNRLRDKIATIGTLNNRGTHLEIPLTQGFVAFTDVCDLKRLKKRHWCSARGIPVTGAKGSVGHCYLSHYLMHPKKGERVVHLDGNKRNCRRSNMAVYNSTTRALVKGPPKAPDRIPVVPPQPKGVYIPPCPPAKIRMEEEQAPKVRGRPRKEATAPFTDSTHLDSGFAHMVRCIKSPVDLSMFKHHKVGDDVTERNDPLAKKDQIRQIAFVQNVASVGPATEGAVVFFFESGAVGSSFVTVHAQP